MATEFNGNVAVNLAGRLTSDIFEFGEARFPLNINERNRYANGTGNNQANNCYVDVRTLASGDSEELDLAGVLENVYGALITFTKVKALYIENHDLVNSLQIGGSASNGFISWAGGATHTIKIAPGGRLLLEAPLGGYAVTADTADKLKVLHNAEDGTSAEYAIAIIGTV